MVSVWRVVDRTFITASHWRIAWVAIAAGLQMTSGQLVDCQVVCKAKHVANMFGMGREMLQLLWAVVQAPCTLITSSVAQTLLWLAEILPFSHLACSCRRLPGLGLLVNLQTRGSGWSLLSGTWRATALRTLSGAGPRGLLVNDLPYETCAPVNYE
jgi:hypothetical protein